MSSQQVLDTLENLGLDLEEYKEILDDLKDNFSELIDLAKTAINHSNGQEASDHLHSMKGSSGSLGLQATYEKCKELELTYKKSLDDNSLANLDELIKIYDEEMIKIRESL